MTAWRDIKEAPRNGDQFLIHYLAQCMVFYAVVTWPEKEKSPIDSEGWCYDDAKEFAYIDPPSSRSYA